MFSLASRKFARALPVGRRFMSGHGSEAEVKAEVDRWYKMTLGMIGVSSLFLVYNVLAHSHEHARTGLPYQHIRNKPYPWKCSDCNLFDMDCWDECRGKGKKNHEEHH